MVLQMIRCLILKQYFHLRALLASKFLNEKLSFIGKIGCGLCVLGSTVIVLNAPEQQEIYTMNELVYKFRDPSKYVPPSV